MGEDMIKRILLWFLRDSEDDLYDRYKNEVVECHPFDPDVIPLPYSFEEWKNLESSLEVSK